MSTNRVTFRRVEHRWPTGLTETRLVARRAGEIVGVVTRSPMLECYDHWRCGMCKGSGGGPDGRSLLRQHIHSKHPVERAA